MKLAVIRANYLRLPHTVRLFLQRALLLFTGWKLLYNGFLQQRGIPDKWITSATGDVTAWLVSLVYQPSYAVMRVEKSYIYTGDKLILAIADGCNGLELFITFVGFLICLPDGIGKFWRYALTGTLAIFILNILRSAAIVWINIHHPEWTDLAHHYIFQVMMYAFIFWLWIKYSRSLFGNEEKGK